MPRRSSRSRVTERRALDGRASPSRSVCVEYLTAQMALPGDTIPHWMGASMDPLAAPHSPGRAASTSATAVEAVFQKALAVNPNDRYRHMQQFWNDLRMQLV